ncbi:PREDICTED: integrator complex subunit 6 homolog [Tarenaya hassleriana]|uniref:integrator complex subunit 6 homolog n=1 Tax=Tarenaya hassleriana TaxID=28532 RepID=UPI00053C0FDE|nr:PREDICTED: integrator complex subunit 6 homolog [Tarenaya hassleriana]
MDSANSSSMQSSSGGDEEYESRTDQSISAFLDHHHHQHLSNAPPPPELLHFNNPFLSNYFDNNPLSSSSSSYTFLTQNPSSRPDPTTSQPITASLPPPPPPPPPPPHSNINNSNSNSNMGVVKRSKKRTRASRRAPTTVLTTDTSNFRAMVQEFTGIPAPPLFSNDVVNTRLNTFLGLSPSPSSLSSTSYNLLLRPFAQKLVPTSPLLSSLSSSSSDAVLRTSINNNQLHHCSSGDVFRNIHLQSLLQVPDTNTNPRSDHRNVFTEEFGLGGLQSRDPPSTLTNKDGDNGGYGDSDHHDENPLRLIAENGDSEGMENPTAPRNEGMVESWLCSSTDQRT